MRKRDKLYYKNKHQPSSEKSRKLKSLKHLIQSQSRKAYWDYVEDLITPKKRKLSKKFYTFIKHKKTDSTGIKTLKKNGSTITDLEQKADLLNNHFFSVFSEQIPMKLSALCKYFTNLFPNHEQDMPEIQVTEKGVLKLLQALNISKAAGPDGIRPRVLKELSSELAPIFTLLFQASLHQQSIPDIWKHANVTPIYKKGDKTNPSNYRPVSLTCISCKLLEHIICSRLMQHLTKHNILYPLQHGFRDKRSCESQLIEFVNDIAFNMQKGHQNDVVVIDFAKAFDRVAHNRLLYKLSSYGVKGNTLGWIGSFLSGRSQKVVLEGKSSSSAPVLTGVPQGSVLGPVLFLIYINDLPEYVSNSTVRLFADATLLYLTIHNSSDCTKLQDDLNNLQKWESDWQMSFHPEKCEVIHITTKKYPIIHKYTLHGHTLLSVPQIKYLCVQIS